MLRLHHREVDSMSTRVCEQGKLTLDVMKESKKVDKVNVIVESEMNDKICISYWISPELPHVFNRKSNA